MKILDEVKFHYVLMEDKNDWYLTFMSGGPVEIDYCVQLRSEEMERIKADHKSVEAIIKELKAAHSSLMARRICPSIWP